MQDLAASLVELDATVDRVIGGLRAAGAVRGADDDGLLESAAVVARIQRRLEGVQVEIVGEVDERITGREHAARITTRHGCRSLSELTQRTTLCSAQSASALARVASATRRAVAPSSGERLPSEFPALLQALQDGAVGLEGMSAVLGPLTDLQHAVGGEAMRRAEAEVASAARGSAAPPLGASELRVLAQVLAAYLDPDGSEPRDALALRKRGVTLGAGRDGLVPIRGNLLPDVAAQLQRIFDSILNPKVDGSAITGPRFTGSRELDDSVPDDPRTRGQKQHDALAAALSVAARAGELPTIGGAAPTLVVSVRAEDYLAGTGGAAVDGVDEPVPLDVARQVACGGSIQRVVFGGDGRILALGVTDRVFSHRQRVAISLRDGGCIIPGCSVPAAWCEVHHVDEHSRGGPTHTDNGVLVCWFHHRTLDRDRWQIRMRQGVPEVRGPSWWDPRRRWHASTKSRVRQLDSLTG
jgi:hypothetical protein